MTIAEKIYQQAEQLPAPLQMTVLEFVEYLVTKLRSKPSVEEDEDVLWSQFSLQIGSLENNIRSTKQQTYITAIHPLDSFV